MPQFDEQLLTGDIRQADVADGQRIVLVQQARHRKAAALEPVAGIAFHVQPLDERLAQYDLDRLGKMLGAGRDYQFGYLGLQILYDRYFLHVDGRRIELPQVFFMRVAMGLALNEPQAQREARAIEFYNVLSSFDVMSSTPTLFNSAAMRSQLAEQRARQRGGIGQ